MVVAEALSFGVPVICLKNEGPGEFVTPESSFAIPVGNRAATIQGLADDLHTLFLHPALHQQMRQSARQLFLDRFHWDRRGEQLNTVYNNI